ncbi:MAG: Bro-N domain-containing protein [Muribaculaceae bacterium]|nr:Bro-N domain-containing protein [Muribaculaceae bacterium]
MIKKNQIQLFNENKIRTVWDSDTEEWYFSVVDVVQVLSESENPRRYLSDLKRKLKKEGSEVYENIVQLKLPASDGKMRMTDVATSEQLFRIIQSIPSPKAEPFKQWMAQVAATRLDQLQDPELSIEQAVADYRRLGYSEEWINQRIRGIEVRKLLTDEWKRGRVPNEKYGMLTDIITKQWSGMKTREYKDFKGLHKESLRDNMTNIELALNMLAEASATEISKQQNPTSIGHHVSIAKSGGNVAKAARNELETKLGRSVLSSAKAQDYLENQTTKKEIE